jgi:hypothetical protein
MLHLLLLLMMMMMMLLLVKDHIVEYRAVGNRFE